MIVLADHFRREHDDRNREWQRQMAHRHQERLDRERKERTADDNDADFFAAAIELVRATDQQIEAFTDRLDHYDQATVAALMENERALELLQVQIDAMLARAHVMEDGRRVFLTRDKTQAFDEFGTEVLANELDFDAISADAPYWEEFQPLLIQQETLEAERQQLLEFQEKLDETREAVSDGDISEAELERLDQELKDLAPPSLEAHLPEEMRSKAKPQQTIDQLSAPQGATAAPAAAPILGGS